MIKYISNELCHFVGRSKSTESERFDLLTHIVKGGRLVANIQNQDKPTIQSSSNYKANRLGEIFEQNDVVCFCDIPRKSLGIHTNKYSEFGISFKKKFVSKNGGRPVMYVPSNHDITEKTNTTNPKNPNDYFTTLAFETMNFSSILMLINAFFSFENLLKELELLLPEKQFSLLDEKIINRIKGGDVHSMLFSHQSAFLTLLAFVKLFDCQMDDLDENNYYMEREWRILDNIKFDLSDIECVFLPSVLFKDYFSVSFPDYHGDFHIFD